MMKKLFLSFFCLLSLAMFAPAPLAQGGIAAATTATVINAELDSKLMRRKMPYRVVVPLGYSADNTTRYPVLYLLHGLGGNYKNWTESSKLTEHAMRHKIIIVTPDGANGWYSDSATAPNDKYESYIAQELIAEVDKNYRTRATRGGRAIGGLSMGGFGALKFGAKYPDKFVFAASLSGAVQLASWQTPEQLPAQLRPSIVGVFGAAESATKKSNDLFQIIKDAPADKFPFFYLDCGTEDEFRLLAPNQQLAAIMVERKIPHEFRQLPGRHNWAYWNNQVQDVLRISDRFFNAPTAK